MSDKADKKNDQRASRDASTCLGDTQVSIRLVQVQDSFGSSTRPIIGVDSEVIRFHGLGAFGSERHRYAIA